MKKNTVEDEDPKEKRRHTLARWVSNICNRDPMIRIRYAAARLKRDQQRAARIDGAMAVAPASHAETWHRSIGAPHSVFA